MSDISKLADEMAQLAHGFLAMLSPEQRSKANPPFEDETLRRSWYYTPSERAGLPMIEMRPTQRAQALRLLASGLSETGFNAVATVMGLENVLDRAENFSDRPYSGRQVESRFRDPGLYFVAVFGNPGGDGPWGWHAGGHHVSVHYTVRDGAVAATPAFFGANPAVAPMPGGLLLRPLGAEEDLARSLLSLLRPDQAAQAIVTETAPRDIVQTNRPRLEEGALPRSFGTFAPGATARNANEMESGLAPEVEAKVRYSSTAPIGLAGSAMDAGQREALSRLVHLYIDRVAPPLAAQYAALFKPEKTSFGWAGSVQPGEAHYYRIQAPRLLIEYDNVQNGANHIHSVLRDPANDFGDDILAQHYAQAH
jgi:hypothetical protein